MNAATLPAGFKYTAAFLAGRPIHKDDHFAYRHPRMDRGKRAKIFAPFDALDGYSESIAAKNVQYVERIQLEEYEKNRLDNQFRILQTLTRNGKVARANKIVVSVTYYIPCMDENNFSFLKMGGYVTETGICWKVDPDITRTMKVGEIEIPLDDIVEVTAADEELFEKCEWAV